jgi:hypothetical protein
VRSSIVPLLFDLLIDALCDCFLACALVSNVDTRVPLAVHRIAAICCGRNEFGKSRCPFKGGTELSCIGCNASEIDCIP